MNFKDLNLTQAILDAVEDAGYSAPTEVQAKAIPHMLQGRDVMGCAQTGTGKTAAFAIPIIQKISEGNNRKTKIRALVVTPTRELAQQIESSFRMYSKYVNMKSLAIYGGVSQHRQVKQLKKGVDVLIATPGRLLDLMNQGFVKTGAIETLVLDEADTMLDMGFIHDIKKIMARIPEKKQRLFFSATIPKSIKKLAAGILHNPVKVIIKPEVTAAETVHQSVYFVEQKEKTGLLVSLLKGETIDRALVFTRTKRGADRLTKQLSKKGIKSAAIHGNKSQRKRGNTLKAFKGKKIRVLVATDVASRGIDIDELSHVFNYNLPNVPETYVHRIGRTGRAGNEGVAISFCDKRERKDLKNIQKLIGRKMAVNN